MYARTSIDSLPTAKLAKAIADTAGSRSAPVTSIFYINRDGDEGRREFIEWYLREANVQGERICAVEGLDVPQSLVRYFFNGNTQCSQLSPAEVGVYASHLTAARLIVERGLDHALILEDDAEVAPDLEPSLKDVFAQLPAGWDFVHLCGDGRFATKPVACLKQSKTLVRFSRVPSGAFAYLISRSGAEKFLAPPKRFWPVDTDLRQPWRFGLQIYGVMPALVDHSGRFPSTIAKGPKSERSRLRRGLPIPSRHCWTGNPLHTPQGFYFNLKTLGPRWWASCWLENMKRRAARMVVRKSRVRGQRQVAAKPAPLSGLVTKSIA